MRLRSNALARNFGFLCITFSLLAACKDEAPKKPLDAPADVPEETVTTYQNLNVLTAEERNNFSGLGVFVSTSAEGEPYKQSVYKGKWKKGLPNGPGVGTQTDQEKEVTNDGEWRDGKLYNGERRVKYYHIPDQTGVWVFKNGVMQSFKVEQKMPEPIKVYTI